MCGKRVNERFLPVPICAQVQEYLTRFESIPDILELDHLTVSGDVTFGKNVSLKVNWASVLLGVVEFYKNHCGK